MTIRLLINLTAVLTERDPDKNLPINIRKKIKCQESCGVFLAPTASQMNITIKYRDRLTTKYESQWAAGLLQTCPDVTHSGARCYLYATSLMLPNIACYGFCKPEKDEAGQRSKCPTIPVGNFSQCPDVDHY